MSTTLRIVLVLVVLFLIDLYGWRGIQTAIALRSASLQCVLRITYWPVSFGMLAVIGFGAARIGVLCSSHNNAFTYSVMNLFVLLLLPKLVIIVFHGLEDLWEFFRWAWCKLALGAGSSEVDPGRMRFLSEPKLFLAIHSNSLL